LAKLPNHRRVKLHRNYSVEEAAGCLNSHKNTVRRWIKEGLPTVGGRGHLRSALLWGNDDPLFPKTQVAVGAKGTFEAVGLERECWSTAQPIRDIFRQAFELAGLPYFNPHSFRNTLAQLGERLSPNAEALKAWSQNLGHSGVLTTLMSYGTVAPARQAEVIRSMAIAPAADPQALRRLQAFIQAEASRMSGGAG
jgi:integrase